MLLAGDIGGTKGRTSTLLENVPVHVIFNPKVALLGAAYHGLET